MNDPVLGGRVRPAGVRVNAMAAGPVLTTGAVIAADSGRTAI
jgi:enoyl-[acyl-carrier-protein] reductase (NADH)